MRAVISFYTDALKIALQSIFAHKLRAFLTLIGIIIGVASVVTVGASISGLNTYVVEKVSKVLGSNHFMIARMAFSGRMSDEEFERRNRRNKRLNWDDYEWVKEHCQSCSEVGAQTGSGTDLRQDGIEFPGAQVFGSSANMVDIEDKTIADGAVLPWNVGGRRLSMDAAGELGVRLDVPYRKLTRKEQDLVMYGEPVKQPIEEHDPTRPTNPYGETKLAFERILEWFARAVQTLEGLEQKRPKDALIQPALRDALWDRANALKRLGRPADALKDCDRALEIRPRYLDALDSRGLVNLKMGQHSNAIADYDAALRINPKHASALYGRGIAKLRSGNTTGGNGDIAAAKLIQSDIADEFATYGIR